MGEEILNLFLQAIRLVMVECGLLSAWEQFDAHAGSLALNGPLGQFLLNSVPTSSGAFDRQERSPYAGNSSGFQRESSGSRVGGTEVVVSQDVALYLAELATVLPIMASPHTDYRVIHRGIDTMSYFLRTIRFSSCNKSKQVEFDGYVQQVFQYNDLLWRKRVDVASGDATAQHQAVIGVPRMDHEVHLSPLVMRVDESSQPPLLSSSSTTVNRSVNNSNSGRELAEQTRQSSRHISPTRSRHNDSFSYQHPSAVSAFRLRESTDTPMPRASEQQQQQQAMAGGVSFPPQRDSVLGPTALHFSQPSPEPVVVKRRSPVRNRTAGGEEPNVAPPQDTEFYRKAQSGRIPGSYYRQTELPASSLPLQHSGNCNGSTPIGGADLAGGGGGYNGSLTPPPVSFVQQRKYTSPAPHHHQQPSDSHLLASSSSVRMSMPVSPVHHVSVQRDSPFRSSAIEDLTPSRRTPRPDRALPPEVPSPIQGFKRKATVR